MFQVLETFPYGLKIKKMSWNPYFVHKFLTFPTHASNKVITVFFEEVSAKQLELHVLGDTNSLCIDRPIRSHRYSMCERSGDLAG